MAPAGDQAAQASSKSCEENPEGVCSGLCFAGRGSHGFGRFSERTCAIKGFVAYN